MYIFVLLVQSGDNFYFIVNQMLSQNVGTGIIIIKRPSHRNRSPRKDPTSSLEGAYPFPARGKRGKGDEGDTVQNHR